jgi:hypothetical protein
MLTLILSFQFQTYSPDIAITDMTFDPYDIESDEEGIELKNLFTKPTVFVKSKLEKRLKCIEKLKPAHKHIKLPKNLALFLRDCAIWLEKAVNNEEIDEKELLKEFKLSESGDIFRGKYKENKFSGICLSGNNELIEAHFADGIIERGKIRILYSNGGTLLTNTHFLFHIHTQ